MEKEKKDASEVQAKQEKEEAERTAKKEKEEADKKAREEKQEKQEVYFLLNYCSVVKLFTNLLFTMNRLTKRLKRKRRQQH